MTLDSMAKKPGRREETATWKRLCWIEHRRKLLATDQGMAGDPNFDKYMANKEHYGMHQVEGAWFSARQLAKPVCNRRCC